MVSRPVNLSWHDRPLTLTRADAHCRHGGGGRVTHTPRIAGRSGGRRFRVALASIRSCCVGDPAARTAWWEGVESWLRCYRSLAGTDCDPGWFDEDLARLVVRELARRVPRPTLAEMGDHVRAKARRDAEIDARIAPLKASILRAARGVDIDGSNA